MDIKIAGLSREIMTQALDQAREGRIHILAKMAETLGEARGDLSKYAPRITTLKVKPDQIRLVIGPGGKTIKGIIDQTGVAIDVEDDGTVNIASSDPEGEKDEQRGFGKREPYAQLTDRDLCAVSGLKRTMPTDLSLRGALARLAAENSECGPMLNLRSSVPMLRFLARTNVAELVARGCATPDHVIRTKPEPLLLMGLDFGDHDALTAHLESAIVQYAHNYEQYFAEMCAEKGARKKLDPWPRVILVPGIGVITAGRTAREAAIAADIYEHTISIIEDAEAIGTYAPVSRDHLFDVEYWSLEQAKIKKVAQAELAGKIVLVTGAASGIGKATAKKFLELGAHVVLADRDGEALVAVHSEHAKYGDRATFIVADVTDETLIFRMFDHVLTHFGGLDVIISNAGNAPEGRLDTGPGHAALAASLQTNLMSHASVVKRASEIFLAQKNGGALLFNASKAAFNPGPNFGPYAIAKSALVALMVRRTSKGGSASESRTHRLRKAIYARFLASNGRCRFEHFQSTGRPAARAAPSLQRGELLDHLFPVAEFLEQRR
ncbi:MAG: SDR family NAD(P)-dependent oxidoreductase, partial [Polyangiaceae bacterium]